MVTLNIVRVAPAIDVLPCCYPFTHLRLSPFSLLFVSLILSDSISDFPSEFKDSQDGAYDNGMQHSVGEFECLSGSGSEWDSVSASGSECGSVCG